MKTFVLLITLLVLLPFFASAIPFAVYCPKLQGKISFTRGADNGVEYIQVSVNGTFLEYLPRETSQFAFTAGNKPHDAINALCGASGFTISAL